MHFPEITIETTSPLQLNLAALARQHNKFSELSRFTVQVAGAAVYYGDEPPAAFTLAGLKPKTSSKIISLRHTVSGELVTGRQKILAGMIIEDSEDQLGADTVVYEVQDNQIRVSTAAVGSSLTDMTFTMPVVSATNGIKIAAGGRETFETTASNKFLNKTMWFVVASGTATVQIHYETY